MSSLERCPYFRGVLIEGFHCIYLAVRMFLCSSKEAKYKACLHHLVAIYCGTQGTMWVSGERGGEHGGGRRNHED